MALWEIVRENAQTIGSYDLATGDVQYRNWSNIAVFNLATTMLTSLTGSGPMVSASSVQALAAVGTQDILVQLTTNFGQQSGVPEPTTVVGVGVGLVAMAVMKRRKSA
ncbi:MAG: PEP-CTERM sorting domain-containing protein [Acidobacteriota bacterium]